MKVLIITMYHPELVRGGSQQMAYELFQGLQEVPGVTPVLLASIDHTTPAWFKSGARIIGFDGRPNEFLFLSQDYDYKWHKNPHPVLAQGFAEFLRLIQPDVVHFNHFQTFGIDYLTLARRVLPHALIVFTAHEFLAICAAAGHMVRLTDASLCTHASPARCHQCRPGDPPEHYFMRQQWMQTHMAAVDRFTVPSRFMIETYANWGLDPGKFVQIQNGLRLTPPLPAAPPARRNRFGFFGQLIDVKGLHVLLEAVALLRAQGFDDFSVEVNGSNIEFATPERRAGIEAFAASEAALPYAARRVVFNGAYHHDQLGARMARVDWVVVPSIWWEIFCLVVSEAWGHGRPVIAADIGGLAERITPEKDGLLFALGDARALAATMHRACLEDGLWKRLADGITPPPTRDEMVQGFMEVYSGVARGAGGAGGRQKTGP